jgi:hypothetical protein
VKALQAVCVGEKSCTGGASAGLTRLTQSRIRVAEQQLQNQQCARYKTSEKLRSESEKCFAHFSGLFADTRSILCNVFVRGVLLPNTEDVPQCESTVFLRCRYSTERVGPCCRCHFNISPSPHYVVGSSGGHDAGSCSTVITGCQDTPASAPGTSRALSSCRSLKALRIVASVTPVT